MTNVQALKEVYVALGGYADDLKAKTNDEAIHLISTVVASGIASVLPKVSSANNGQVLTVVSVKWKNASLPS